MARVTLPIQTYLLPNGAANDNGYITIRLNKDGNASGNQITSNFATVSLDISGTVVGSPMVYQNSSIEPSGTYYIINVYSANGQLISGPNLQNV